MSVKEILKADWMLRMLLAALWAIAIMVVAPSGNFPLNDDWHFAVPVKSLLETGRFELATALPPNIFLHVGIGLVACKVFGGFSFAASLFLSSSNDGL